MEAVRLAMNKEVFSFKLLNRGTYKKIKDSATGAEMRDDRTSVQLVFIFSVMERKQVLYNRESSQFTGASPFLFGLFNSRQFTSETSLGNNFQTSSSSLAVSSEI